MAETASASRTRTIAVLRKNNLEDLYVQAIDVGGTSLIDIRAFRPSARSAGEPLPTKNGVCLPRAKLRALIDALVTAEAA